MPVLNEKHECHIGDLVFSNKVNLDGEECVSVPAKCRKCGKEYEEVYSKNDGLWDPDKKEYVFLPP
jgi:predicted Zn-ribbon and HTH transcriptional regulator